MIRVEEDCHVLESLPCKGCMLGKPLLLQTRRLFLFLLQVFLLKHGRCESDESFQMMSE